MKCLWDFLWCCKFLRGSVPFRLFVKRAGVCFLQMTLIYKTNFMRWGKQLSFKLYTYFLFVQDLHGVELVCSFMLDEQYSPKWAGTQSLEPIEVIQACCALRKHIVREHETAEWWLKYSISTSRFDFSACGCYWMNVMFSLIYFVYMF